VERLSSGQSKCFVILSKTWKFKLKNSLPQAGDIAGKSSLYGQSIFLVSRGFCSINYFVSFRVKVCDGLHLGQDGLFELEILPRKIPIYTRVESLDHITLSKPKCYKKLLCFFRLET
jgi:hypothetical protein